MNPDQINKDRIMDAFLKLQNKRLIIGGSIVVILGLLLLAFISFQPIGTTRAKSTQTVKTGEVTTGDLTTEVSGTGKIVAPNAVDLSFSTTGKVAELTVNPGNQVEEGDVLAKLDRISALEEAVESAKLDLTKSQKTLDDLTTNKEITLSNALNVRAAAAEALETAQKNEVNKYSPRCDPETTKVYYFDYMYARHDYLYWYNALIKKSTGYGDMYIQERMAPYKVTMNQNYSNWKYCEGYSELEIEQSKATVEKAQADYDKASDYYDKVKANDGIDPNEQALAEASKKNAELQLEQAQSTLNGATMVSPIDGTVMSVASAVGTILDKDTYKSPYIEVADLSQSVVLANFDESDLATLNSNCAASITFTSLPNDTFEGTITQINPAMTESNSVKTIQSYISLKSNSTTKSLTLPVGLNASVKLTCVIARNVTIVPQSALKNETDNKATVYVLNADGTTSAQTVTVGTKTEEGAEVTGDLKAGDKVVTSTVK
jgi:HlyD family secretion protein